jgi:hypothetical protein
MHHIFTAILKLEAISYNMGTVEDGRIKEIPGYMLVFPDGHQHWVSEDDLWRFYIKKHPPRARLGGVRG